MGSQQKQNKHSLAFLMVLTTAASITMETVFFFLVYWPCGHCSVSTELTFDFLLLIAA